MEGGRNGLRRSDKSAAGLCLTQDANTNGLHTQNPDRRPGACNKMNAGTKPKTA